MADNNNNSPLGEYCLDPADAAHYMDELREKLFELCSSSSTIEEIEDRLRKLYPDSALIEAAIREANSKSRSENHKNHKTRNHSSSSGSSLLHNITSRISINYRSKGESEVNKFTRTLVEYIIGDVFTLAATFVHNYKTGDFIITRSDIRTAMHADPNLRDLFLVEHSQANHNNHSTSHHSDQMSKTYKQKVRRMVDDENSFTRELKLIIKVFKAQLEELPNIRREVQILFCNIDDLLELSTLLLTAFEEALESVGQEDEIPFVGREISDIATVEDFLFYHTFANLRLHPEWKRAYQCIVCNESTMTSIRTAGQSFDLAVKHLLPKYLLNTIDHFPVYFRNISDLYKLSKSDDKHNNLDDQMILKQSIAILKGTKKAIEELVKDAQDDLESLDAKQEESIRATLERRLDAELQHERNMALPYMPPPEIYRFSEPDSEDNIRFEDPQNNRTISHKDLDKHFRSETDQIPVIRHASLTKLVERLTYHKYQPNIVDSFLTTYRSFSNPEELLNLLIERFKIPDPPISVMFPDFNGDSLPENDSIAYKRYMRRFRQEYSKPVKMRVINVFKSWIKNHFYDFESHPALLDKLLEFLDEVYETDKILRSLIVSIKKSIDQKKNSHKDDFEFMLSKSPPPILWWAVKANEPEKFDVLTLHPVEFARQLTLIEFDLFRAIKPAEFMNSVDKSLDLTDTHDCNVQRMTKHFTMFSYWIRKCIVETDDFDKRSAIYNRFIEMMGVLRELNNFTGLLSIGSAICSAGIDRLVHTKNTLNYTTSKIMDDYKELNDYHQRKLNDELKKCNPPCIPYCGTYQSWLLQAKEGNSTYVDGPKTSSPTLSCDGFHSSFSNSPATPISPKTPHPPRSTNTPNAISTSHNLFFGSLNTSAQSPPSVQLINFRKQRMRANLVAEISNYQNSPYCLEVQPEIRRFIESIEDKLIAFAYTLGGLAADNTDIKKITNRLDDYLFDQSKRIEPKNCTKPPRSKSKPPDYWKSPGIKVNTNVHKNAV